ncbi:MAG: hypothetical protein NZM11_00755 [Anaerolineales bacterium]|nr:hypothetical protein [Anaerolineales bacterium]
MTSHISSRPNGKKPKSSPEARKLIRAVLKQCGGNQREAARRLRLPNQAQLRKMLNGTIRDTPAMHAALMRARKRAERAWAMERPAPPKPVVCVEQVREALRRIRYKIDALDYLLKGEDSDEAKGL